MLLSSLVHTSPGGSDINCCVLTQVKPDSIPQLGSTSLTILHTYMYNPMHGQEYIIEYTDPGDVLLNHG